MFVKRIMTKGLQELIIGIIVSKEFTKDKKIKQIRAILEKNPDIVDIRIGNKSLSKFRVVSSYGDKITLLHLVAQLGYVEIAQLLIEKGADVNAVGGDKLQNTPLHRAALYGNKEVVELLLKHGANIESKDYGHHTPLHKASSSGHDKVVELLLEKGANVNAVTSDYSGHRETSLHKAIVNSHINNYLKIIKMLLDYGANTEIEDLHEGTPLYIAVAWGRIKAIKLLLCAKANVNCVNKRGETPLHVVVNGGSESNSEERCEVVEFLLKHGANVHAKDENGSTPLHKAALERSKGVAALLLEHGANINEKNRYGITPLEKATCGILINSINVKVDPWPIAKFLIEHTFKNNPFTEKPDFMKKMENSSYTPEVKYSNYWDEYQKKQSA